jgi:hypothetical protein
MTRVRIRLLGSATLGASLALLGAGCRDLQRFSTGNDHFEGGITKGSFARAGFTDDVRICLTLDADNLQDTPGAVSSTDGRFRRTPLRPIPQLSHDPLSTLDFGQGRLKNLVYALSPAVDAGGPEDVLAVVSLMDSNDVEVRLLRGAPQPTDAEAAQASPNMFGIFRLQRARGPCSF